MNFRTFLWNPMVWCFFNTILAGLSSCATSVDLVGVARNIKEKAEGPPPETQWNETKIWERVADHPPTYVPTEYGSTSPRTEETGTWFEDARDGKRLFVPKLQVGEFQPGVLRGEAKKVTNWTNRELLSTSPGIMAMPGGFVPLKDLPYLIPQSR